MPCATYSESTSVPDRAASQILLDSFWLTKANWRNSADDTACGFQSQPPTLRRVAWPEILILVILGLVAGALGGLLGVGGSIVMIPVLTQLLGYDQHLAQAAAMIVGIFVAAPSVLRHNQSDSVRWDVTLRMLPAGLLVIVIGVWASNQFSGENLERIFGVFLLYVVSIETIKLVQQRPEPHEAQHRVTWPRCSAVGTMTGFLAGLLGVGGGIVTVPLLQRVCRLPLRQCIATSSAVMVLTAIVGSIRKNVTLAQHMSHGQPLEMRTSLTLAAFLIPTAIAGAWLGAHLTHALPLRGVRLAFILLLLWAGIDMLAQG